MARTRIRRSGPLTGTGQYLGTPISATRAWSLESTCADTVGIDSDHPCTITHKSFEGGLNVFQPSAATHFDGMPCTLQFAAFMSAPLLTSYTNRILAGSGPLTPRLNLPLFVYELKDIPMMLKHAGDLLHKIGGRSGLDPAKEAAAATLAFQFGWAPLLGDLKKLVDFSDAVNRKQQELKKANSRRGIKRRIKLDSDSHIQRGNVTVWSTYGLVLSPLAHTYLSYETWATVRWKLLDTNQIGRTPTHGEAFSTALGLNPGEIPITVWKALPWSWMIDWFADISNVMQARYNMLYYKPSGLCIMRHSKSDTYYDPIIDVPSKKLKFSPGRAFTERKERTVSAYPQPSVTLKLPFLDNFKLSILGSLAILKIKK